MANKYYYLRSVSGEEMTGELRTPSRGRRVALSAPGKYKLGCSASLVDTLTYKNCGVITRLLGGLGLTYAYDANPTQASLVAWQFSTDPTQETQATRPWEEGFVDDMNSPLIDNRFIAAQIVEAFRTEREYFSRYDGFCEDSIFLTDFTTDFVSPENYKII